ncbi:hypothetical protein BDQ12DRAFT_650858 [Crucibulum laeve]|uniref:HCP-like protein n=1 Tax=Crucibulum laeve TaxID=68775 RepID=A0A5C3LZS7_9AGAR|nr:hypothetical protein BDQ12DRAFT_650858 [Crucibulum laeve]
MMAAYNQSSSPSAFTLQHSSPLDTLVRRTSSRRARAPAESSRYLPGTPETPVIRYDNEAQSWQNNSDAQYAYATNSYAPIPTPPRQNQPQYQHLTPASPLLHSRFTRDSTATASTDNNSYLDNSRASLDSRNYQDPELQYRYYDTDSIYSDATTSPALRDSWRSTGTARPPNLTNDPPVHSSLDDGHAPMGIPYPPSPSSPHSPVPTVVVSSPSAEGQSIDYTNRAGRAPIIRSITSNFSRPVRAPSSGPIEAQQRPPPPSDLEEQKRRVLERNATRRGASPNPSSTYQSLPNSPLIRNQVSAPNLRGGLPSSPLSTQNSNSSNLSIRSQDPRSLARSASALGPAPSSQSRSLSPNPNSDYFQAQHTSTPRNLAPSMVPNQSPNLSSLNQPPPRNSSPVSLYSNYSYYPYDSNTPSPTTTSFVNPQNLSPNPNSQPKSNVAPSSRPITPQGPSIPLTEATASTPQDYLQLGIQHHEANRLTESAKYFEKSAKENGGCGVGMLMYGLTLRHGWGCEKNEKTGFKWLQKAAEHAVEDLESARGGGGVDPKAVQSELVLAIYEVGQCFFHGWGVVKDQKMAVSYYTVAARLGDSDAQHDLAFCLANGKGCKKDRKAAAKWYRAAVAQGQSDIGLAWIYKEKYQ